LVCERNNFFPVLQQDNWKLGCKNNELVLNYSPDDNILKETTSKKSKVRKGWRRKLGWAAAGLLAAGLRAWAGFHPGVVEHYYSRGLFLGIRWLIDYLFSWIPVPLIYLFFIVLASAFFRYFRRLYRHSLPLKQKAGDLGLSTLSFLGGVVFAFLFLWGFNYSREPIENQMNLTLSPLTLDVLESELELETTRLTALRVEIPGATDSALTTAFLPEHMETQLRKNLEGWLAAHHFPTVGRVRARQLFPRGIFLRFSSSGLYFPWTGEGHVDAGVHPLLKPSVMTHEMAHGYGFGDEGTCNFLAYLSCRQSETPIIAYAGHLSYWRTLAANYLRYKPEEYRAFRQTLPPGIQADLDAINENLASYPDIMPRLRHYAYDTYLKTQGIKEGMLNYNRVLMLVHAWRKDNEK
jgi:hypothetical protein